MEDWSSQKHVRRAHAYSHTCWHEYLTPQTLKPCCLAFQCAMCDVLCLCKPLPGLKGPLGSPVTLPAIWIKGNQNSCLPISPCSFSTRGSVNLCVGVCLCVCVRGGGGGDIFMMFSEVLLVLKVTNFPLKVKCVICDKVYCEETYISTPFYKIITLNA